MDEAMMRDSLQRGSGGGYLSTLPGETERNEPQRAAFASQIQFADFGGLWVASKQVTSCSGAVKELLRSN
jgi:hypothetical protein